MSIFFRKSAEARSLSYQDLFAGGYDMRGWQAGDLSLVPLYAAHRYIIDQFSSTPLHAYRDTPDGLMRISPQPSLFTEPMPRTTPGTWKGQCVASLLGWGNAIGYEVSTGANGWPSSLMWLAPQRVTCEDSDPTDPQYFYDGKRLERDRVIHIPWLVQPGKVWALSPMGLFRTAFETGLNAQQMAHDWYANGSVPGGILKSEKMLTPEIAQEAKTRFKAMVEGRDLFVSGNDWSYESVALPPDDLRFVEQMKFSATQIATIYGIPPQKIGGEVSSSLTYSTVLMDQLNVQVETLQPWYTRVEEYLTLLALPRPVVAKFNMDATLRADPLARAQTHRANLEAGVETQDEARRLENRPPMTPAERSEWMTAWRGVRDQVQARAEVPAEDGKA